MLIWDFVAWITGSTSWAARVSAVWAASLEHESFDYSMKMQSIVVAFVHQFKEVPSGNWHTVGIKFDIEFSCACCHPNIGHDSYGTLQVQYGIYRSCCYATVDPGIVPSGSSRSLTVPSGSRAPRTRNCETNPVGSVFSPRLMAATTVLPMSCPRV